MKHLTLVLRLVVVCALLWLTFAATGASATPIPDRTIQIGLPIPLVDFHYGNAVFGSP